MPLCDWNLIDHVPSSSFSPVWTYCRAANLDPSVQVWQLGFVLVLAGAVTAAVLRLRPRRTGALPVAGGILASLVLAVAATGTYQNAGVYAVPAWLAAITVAAAVPAVLAALGP